MCCIVDDVQRYSHTHDPPLQTVKIVSIFNLFLHKMGHFSNIRKRKITRARLHTQIEDWT